MMGNKVLVQLIRTEEEMYRTFGCINFRNMLPDISLPLDDFIKKFRMVYGLQVECDMFRLFNAKKIRKVIHLVWGNPYPTLGFEIDTVRYRAWNGMSLTKLNFLRQVEKENLLPFTPFKLEY